MAADFREIGRSGISAPGEKAEEVQIWGGGRMYRGNAAVDT
jgi:hypothetical protein